MNTKVFRNLSCGVYVITTWDEGRPTGCIANSVIQVTANPPMVAVTLNHDNYTTQCISERGKFAVSILAETTEPIIIGKFGFFSGRDMDKFDDVKHSVHGYMPVINDSCGYIVCEVEQTIETPTHTMFLSKVVDGDVFGGTPMTYSYYTNVIKGKGSPKSPSYVAAVDE